ncbi:anthocyanidin reductase ((2S)-flavan-3-ol-forming) [Ananas comosus]|uniref:Anthocyanidin reductase ((2S)-flavan-3-ol-forming) n=1 Tax=Ananas comosus TaxID=4615 RepID=A0A6P5GA04_ANACO|nr:anthocyanidin reductase ((2S)-flavan-3-ol-forming) [Ananas comosus]
MAMQKETKRACVTGGSGYIASELIKQLLLKGYGVKTTVRDPDNAAKISHLEELRGLGALQVYRAELAEEGSFDEAVAGCEYVFLVAAPVNAFSENPEEELIKPASKGTLNVMKSCVKAKSVKRIVLTSSAAAVSLTPLEGIGHVLDEESWSDIEYLQTEKPPSWGYAVSKVVAEKEASKFAQENNISLVTVLPVLTVGPSLIAEARVSLALSLALLSGNEELINGLKIMETLSGSISLVHVEDVCRAHIFVAESPSALGRYICCSVNTGLVELAISLQQRYPQYKVSTDFGGLPAKARLSLSSEKLLKGGFEFKFKKLEEIYDDVVEYAKAKGLLP